MTAAVADVTVCIPTIPPRDALMRRAVSSVEAQTLPPQHVSVFVDHAGAGASVSRNAAAADADTEWLAFLDDDDEFLPHHLQTLTDHANETGADYVFGDFAVPEYPSFRLDSFCYGEFDPAAPLQTTITVMVRRSVFQELGGYLSPQDMTRIHGDVVGEDYDFTKRCVAAGVRISHVAVVTWHWHHWGGNLSGRSWTR